MGNFLPRATMRVSIVSVFLTLTVVAFGSTLTFLNYKNHKIISDFSATEIKTVSSAIVEHLSHLLRSTEQAVQLTAGLIANDAEIDPSNLWLKNYMCKTLAVYPNMPYLFIGDVTGDYLEAGNLLVSKQKHYLGDPSQPLPTSATYEWQYYNRTTTGLDAKTTYYDADFKELDSENVAKSNYDPRTRPWYVNAVKKGTFDWSEVYPFFDTGDLGITAAEPIYNKEHKLIGVVGADLSFEFLTQFLQKQTIGQTGKAFIIDAETGAILLPENPSSLHQRIAEASFKKKPLIIDHERFLVHIEPFPANNSWQIAIIVPFKDFFGTLEKAQKEALYIIFLISAIAALCIAYFAKALSSPIVSLTREIDALQKLDLDHNTRYHSHIKEIDSMDSAIFSLRLALRSFVHYVPRPIVENLFRQNKEIVLGGEKKNVTVVFSDIANFTSITENLPAERVTELLEKYFDTISKIILENQGTIDKYIGDGIMAFWGAPLPIENHATHAAEAILLAKAFVDKLNAEHTTQNKPLLTTRFGIHTGDAIAGNVGTSERMNYTLMGDTVNTAARLQTVNKIYRTSILISEATKLKLPPEFLTRPLDLIEVKGKKNKIAIYELMAKNPSPEQLRLATLFTEAYTKKSRPLFEQILKEFPNDGPTEFHLRG